MEISRECEHLMPVGKSLRATGGTPLYPFSLLTIKISTWSFNLDEGNALANGGLFRLHINIFMWPVACSSWWLFERPMQHLDARLTLEDVLESSYGAVAVRSPIDGAHGADSAQDDARQHKGTEQQLAHALIPKLSHLPFGGHCTLQAKRHKEQEV